MRVAAVIPAYNEAKRVGQVITDVRPLVDTVIVVNDGSTDTTADVSKASGATVITFAENCGAGAATMAGLRAARELGMDCAVTIDADGQHDVRDIPNLLHALTQNGADLAIANRFGQKNTIPLIRRVYNAIGNGLTFLVTGIHLQDSQCGFKAFGPKALQEVNLRMPGFEFCTEIVREAREHKWNIVSIPTKVVYSEYTLAKGQSFANGVRTAVKILLRSLLR